MNALDGSKLADMMQGTELPEVRVYDAAGDLIVSGTVQDFMSDWLSGKLPRLLGVPPGKYGVSVAGVVVAPIIVAPLEPARTVAPLNDGADHFANWPAVMKRYLIQETEDGSCPAGLWRELNARSWEHACELLTGVPANCWHETSQMSIDLASGLSVCRVQEFNEAEQRWSQRWYSAPDGDYRSVAV